MNRDALKILTSATLGLAFGLVSIAHAADADKVLAVVNGKNITEADVRAAKAAELKALEVDHARSLHTVLESGLEELVNRDLVDAEAAARGVTHAEVVASVKAPAVTDAEIDKFYEDNKANIPKPKSEVFEQIRQYLEQQGQKAADDAFIASMKAKYKVEERLEPLRVEVAATGPADGPASAPVTMVEFSDFQCPFCGRLFPTLTALKAKYGEKLRIVFRQYPLPSHQFAAKAAEASLCADEQGKFWAMHDAMFKNQRALAVDDLKTSAAAVGLDAAKFGSCLDSGRTAATVQSDLEDGKAVGVDGTPAVFINGRFLSGAQPIEVLSAIIDDELRRLAR